MSASRARQAFWMIAGYGILIYPCLRRAWVPATSTINPFDRAPRPITLWRSAWLNSIYGNREDGVSGAEALIWDTPPEDHLPAVRVPYRPNTWAPLRAWLWSAWRNSTNELSR